MITKSRREIVAAVTKARGDLDRALANLESIADDDRRRIGYSVHALNNYLMVVSTTVNVMRKRLAVQMDRDVKRWLDSLTHATELMMSTTRAVLAATVIEEDAPPTLLFEPVSFAEIAAGALTAYSSAARRKKIKVVLKVRRAQHDVVQTDRVAAGAVLDNLLSNALKFSPERSTITLMITTTTADATCTVRDGGPGLTEADQEKLFQRGVRLTPRPTGGEASAGYGLAIAKDLATALGGHLSCVSPPEGGSSFIFVLPLSSTDAAGLVPVLDSDNLLTAADAIGRGGGPPAGGG